MTRKINLNSFHFARDLKILAKLNEITNLHDSLEPRTVAVATGWTVSQAMEYLSLLFHLHLAEMYLLVYHNDHPETPYFQRRSISDGFPKGEVFCPLCEKNIVKSEDLSYEITFDLTEEMIVLEAEPLPKADKEQNDPKKRK